MIQSSASSSISSASTALDAVARARLALSSNRSAQAGTSDPANADGASSRSATSSAAKASALTPQEQQQVAELKQIDRQVRAHEQAHLAVGADLVRGGATFSYQTGPDQQRYAVAGEVSIDASPAPTPQETIPKAAHIRATALAPADPSPQDNSVAARASRMESEARAELAALQREAAAAESGNAGLYASGSALGQHLDLFA